jgi:hypothetical protein
LLVKRKKRVISKLEINNENNSRDSCPLCFHTISAKLMQDLGGKTVILRTYEAAVHILV